MNYCYETPTKRNNKIEKVRSLNQLHQLENYSNKRGKKSIQEEIKNCEVSYQTSSKTFNQENVRLERVKSVGGMTNLPTKVDEKNLMELYEKENKNLIKQNTFLKGEIRKQQQKEKILQQYVSSLKQQLLGLKKLQARMSTEQTQQSTNRSTFTSKTINQNQKTSQEYQLDQLNRTFAYLLQKSSGESDQEKRNSIRNQLAGIASQMKNLRNQSTSS